MSSPVSIIDKSGENVWRSGGLGFKPFANPIGDPVSSCVTYCV